MAEMSVTFQPTKKEMETIKFILGKFDYCLRLRNKRYPILGNRTPKQYWDEQEKRFTCYAPPKDVNEDEWQANVVMGITRNAVLTQVSKTGMQVPRTHIQDWTAKGFMSTERSRIWENIHNWGLRRQNADHLQQFVSLGNYVRGNTCVYTGFEDKETEVDLIDEYDFDTGELKYKKGKLQSWGPKRRVVPLDEVYYPNFFKNNLKLQAYVIWARIEDYASLEVKYKGYKNWKKVKPGIWATPAIDDPFFRPRTSLGKNHCFVMSYYGNPREGGEDRLCELVNGVPMGDDCLPFNHKYPPFGWTLNEPLLDSFMLGCGVPFKMMDQQDSADSAQNMLLDKFAISVQKPVMTDDPDVRVENFLYPGGIMKFSKGAQYNLAPIEGVTQGDFNFLQMVIQQAKEFSGAFGGSQALTQRGGKITARQAQMMEEEVKRNLALSLTNLEDLERDLTVLELQNYLQFLPGTEKRIEAQGVRLADGRRGRFVAVLAKNMKDALKLEQENELTMLEVAGEQAGVPTEAVAIAPDWFDLSEKIEAEVVGDSSYQNNTVLAQQLSDERLITLMQLKQVVPSLNLEEALRDNMEKHEEDATKLLSGTVQAPQQGEQPPQPPGQGQAPPQPGQGGPGLGQQMNAGAGSLGALMGTQ